MVILESACIHFFLDLFFHRHEWLIGRTADLFFLTCNFFLGILDIKDYFSFYKFCFSRIALQVSQQFHCFLVCFISPFCCLHCSSYGRKAGIWPLWHIVQITLRAPSCSFRWQVKQYTPQKHRNTVIESPPVPHVSFSWTGECSTVWGADFWLSKNQRLTRSGTVHGSLKTLQKQEEGRLFFPPRSSAPRLVFGDESHVTVAATSSVGHTEPVI